MPCEEAKALSGEKRLATKQLSFREQAKGVGGQEGAVGTMPLQLQVQWLKPCVCVCAESTFFFVLIELICCLFSAASLTHS